MTFEDDNARLTRIKMRLEYISNLEARDALLGGLAARGHFDAERSQLIEETDRILVRLFAHLGLPDDFGEA